MVCGNCGATIAEKAIACYRCGAATAIPTSHRPTTPAPARRPWIVVAMLSIVAVVMAWLSLSGGGIQAPHHVAYLVLAGLTAVTVAYLTMRRRR